jgi:hypothetical protein
MRDALGILLVWLANGSGGSILVAVVAHAASTADPTGHRGVARPLDGFMARRGGHVSGLTEHLAGPNPHPQWRLGGTRALPRGGATTAMCSHRAGAQNP